MYNIVPYLRTHTSRNMSSFQACSKLLASLSSYQYTRKAWRKDVFDLLLDNNLFQMEYSSLKYWKIIIDNLMTHDNTTFRDLMSMFDGSCLMCFYGCVFLFERSRVLNSKWKFEYFLVQGTRIRAEGSAVEALSVCYTL